MTNLLKARQGARAGSAYVAGAFFISGVLTYVFQGFSARFLGEAGYGDLIVLWTTTFLVVQVLWIGVTQTLGRFVSERLSRGEDPRPVISSVRRLQLALLGAFVVAYLLASPLITSALFRGSWALTVALLAAVAAYAPEYFRRGTFNGHRQAARLGVLHVIESSSRAFLAVVLLVLGAGVLGPALAIVLAPLVAVLAVRPTRVRKDVLSPPLGALSPHASRTLATEGPRSFDRFVGRAAGTVGLVGVLMVAGTWLLGEWGIRLFAGEGFDTTRAVLVSLALLAAFYLLAETLNQALFALGHARLAALGWLLGLPVSGLCMALPVADPLYRVSYALTVGAFAAAAAQAT